MMKDERWNDIIDTNLSSVFRMSKAVIRPMMKKRSGRIINISSVKLDPASPSDPLQDKAEVFGAHGDKREKC